MVCPAIRWIATTLPITTSKGIAERNACPPDLFEEKKWIVPRSIGFSEWFGQCRSKWHPRCRCENRVRCPVKEEGALCFWVYCFCPLTSVYQHRASCTRFVSCTRELVWYHIVPKPRSLVKVRRRQTRREPAKISFGAIARQGITKPFVID